MELLNWRWVLQNLQDVGDLPSKAFLTLEMSPTIQEGVQLYDPRHSSVMIIVKCHDTCEVDTGLDKSQCSEKETNTDLRFQGLCPGLL